MRVFLIMAVFAALAHPAAASIYDRTDCIALEQSSYQSYNNAKESLKSATNLIPAITETQQESYEILINYYYKLMAQASHEATIYQAFCKD